MDIGAKVTDGIYIGNIDTTRNDILQLYNIGYIVNLSGREYSCNVPVFNILMDDTDVTFNTIDLYLRKFAAGVAAIESACNKGLNVLVHCSAGVNRSATTIGFYLIEQGWSYEDTFKALETANNSRGVPILTNYSFRYLLKSRADSEKNLRARTAIFNAIANRRFKIVATK